ncbi:hypothetical protein EV359DRAFT_86079 [Lentinula novae-zelandiae]|nr:hypothetical protein EV359DRAFT_86079 [Lentinula novae-zelandiae]
MPDADDISSIRQDTLRAEIARLRGKPVTEMEKMRLYKVFDVVLDGGERVIARCERAGSDQEDPSEAQRRIHKHAAVLDALRKTYRIPVPPIYHVEPNPEVIGAPWILMERIPGGELHYVVSRWDKAVREHNMKIVLAQHAAIYSRIFDTLIPEPLSSMFAEELQHGHIDPMPTAFDIKLHYESFTSDPDILRARAYRQKTATFIAHRFWAVMHDAEYCAEAEGHPDSELPVLHKLKALVPALIPSVEKYLELDNNGQSLLGSKKLHHYDPSVSNIMVDPATADITGIIDWEFTTAAPALLSAAYPEWIRYDGQQSPTSHWSSHLLQLSPDKFEYRKWRETYEENVGQISPNYLKAMRAGRELQELVDWARFAITGWPLNERMAFLDSWANSKAMNFGVDVESVPVLRKKDWMCISIQAEN